MIGHIDSALTLYLCDADADAILSINRLILLFALEDMDTVAISDSEMVVPRFVMIGSFCKSMRFSGLEEADVLIFCAPCSTLPIGIVKSVVVI